MHMCHAVPRCAMLHHAAWAGRAWRSMATAPTAWGSMAHVYGTRLLLPCLRGMTSCARHADAMHVHGAERDCMPQHAVLDMCMALHAAAWRKPTLPRQPCSTHSANLKVRGPTTPAAHARWVFAIWRHLAPGGAMHMPSTAGCAMIFVHGAGDAGNSQWCEMTLKGGGGGGGGKLCSAWVQHAWLKGKHVQHIAMHMRHAARCSRCLRHAAPCCAMLRDAAPCCVVQRHACHADAASRSITQHGAA